MNLVWSVPSTGTITAPSSTSPSLTGCYQDMLRSVGAWLDARGYRLANLSTSGTSVVVEAEVGELGDDITREVIRLDFEALARLMQAARADRDRFQ
jgi:hypothetical protein